MFLLQPAIKYKTIIQTKTEDRQSVTSSNWTRLTNPRKHFSRQINQQDSSVSENSKI